MIVDLEYAVAKSVELEDGSPCLMLIWLEDEGNPPVQRQIWGRGNLLELARLILDMTRLPADDNRGVDTDGCPG